MVPHRYRGGEGREEEEAGGRRKGVGGEGGRGVRRGAREVRRGMGGRGVRQGRGGVGGAGDKGGRGEVGEVTGLEGSAKRVVVRRGRGESGWIASYGDIKERREGGRRRGNKRYRSKKCIMKISHSLPFDQDHSTLLTKNIRNSIEGREEVREDGVEGGREEGAKLLKGLCSSCFRHNESKSKIIKRGREG